MNENNNETNSVAQFIENPLLEINYKQNFPKGGSSHISKQQTSLYQENERLLSSSYKSKEEFTREYKKLYCENLKAKEFYLLVLIKVAKAISDNNVANLKKLSKFIGYVNSVENQATLRDYYNDVKNPIQKTNLVILACQHNKVTILEYLFDNSSNILNSLSVDIGRNITLPNDKDELGHNAFYYAIRSGNIELLDTLINKWPGNYFDINFNELDEIISQPYEELKLKNIPLSEEIEIFIYNKLINLRFFSNVPEQKCNEEGNVNNIIERIDLVLQNIALLKEEFSNREQVNQKFLFIAKFIAQNIHILKRQLKSTYDRLPWEEIEFCLVIFVSSRTNRKEINLFYDATLNKNKLLNHLENFAKRLNDEKAIIEHVDVNLLNVIPNIKREQVIMEIVNNYPQFGELYSDYKKIRDLYSLEKISDYIKLALSADPKQKDGQLIITRALQMIGENLKNTLESPKLSSDTSELLLLSFPNNTRKVIIGLRNSLSHAYSLFKRTEIEENTDVIFFIGIQNDIKKIHDVIFDICHNNKIKIIRILLTKIYNSESSEEIIEIAKAISIVSIDKMFAEDFGMLKHEKLKKLVKELSDKITDKTDYEKFLFYKINNIINCVQNKPERCKNNFLMALASLRSLVSSLNNYDKINHNIIRVTKFYTNNALQNISSQIEPHDLKEIAELSMEIRFTALLRMQRVSDTIDSINTLTSEILFIVEFELDDINWIEELKNQFSEKRAFIPIYKQKKVYNFTGKKNQLSLKLAELKIIFENNAISNTLIQNLSPFKKNKKLISIIELLVLDIMSILGQSNKYLKNNLNFLDDYSPLLTGKSLRNHLAHDNVLFDILLSDLSMAIILNANKLISENIIKNKKKLGKLVTDDPSQLKNKYEKNLITIANQEKMFTALEEGNFEDLKNCLRKGADINARSISSWTTLHFAAKSPSLKIIKYIFDQNINANVKDMNGQNPLHIAAAYGRESIVEFFLREVGLCIDDQDDSGKTPLHIAAKNGHKDAVKSLLKNNANTDIKDIHGFPPLHYAIKNNHIDVAKILLEKETNVDINQVKGGFTSLHIAAENGHVELVNFLLKSRANVNVKTDQGTIPLHLAALNGYLEIVNALIFKGANVNTKTIDGCSPLHYAIENGHEEIANILLKHGANVNVVDKVYNNTPLHYAAKYGHENIVKLLLENKANASIPTVHGITPLHFAIRGGHLKIVATLLEYGVNIHDKDFKSTSPLHQAAQEGHKDIIELLIRNGAKVRTQDIMGNTPLHAAAEFGRTNIIELLIKNKAEVNARNYDGITPLHLGALNKQEDAIIFLIKNKAEINTKNNYGITPLHAAINGGYKNIVIFLIKHKAKINVKDISGNTPLLVAVEAGHQEIVEILIENGADINISNNKNLTPLFSAIKHNRKRIVEVLIENGANINMEVGESLSLAVRAGYREIVEILLQNAAFINIKYPEDVTPLHLATQRNHKEIVNLLIMKGFDVDAMNIHKLTALHLAAQEGHAVVAKILIAKGANVNVANVENTSLHLAAMHGHVNIIKILLSNGAKIDVKDNQNRTPLELAVYHSQLDVVKMLLRHKKVDINAKGKDDWTLLHIASQASNLEMVKFLVNKGSNINARTMSGLKPIHFSAREGNKDTVEFFLSKGLSINELGSTNQTLLHYATKKTQFEVVKYLLTQEAEVNAKDDNDSTPLHIAASVNNKYVVEILLENGADINALDDNGSTPMHIAAAVNNKDIIEILLENGAIYNHINKLSKMPLEIAEKKGIISLLTLTEKLFESIKRNSSLEVENDIKAGAFVNAKHTKLGTSLHYAAWKGYDKIVKILLQNKANPNIVGSKGFTPMHYATKFSHLKIVKYLLTYGAVYNAMSDSGKTPQDFAVDRNINSLLKLIRESFKKVKEDNDQVINDLNKIQDNETVKAVMGSCDNQNKTLIVVAIHCNFSKVEQLKQISQSGISTEILTGSMLLDQGHYQNALNIFRNAFERRKEILGSDNPGTLDIQAKIAMVLYKQGKYQEALTMYEEIFQKQKETLGLNHEDTLSTRSVIALVLYRQENNERAFNIYQDVYQKQKETLGSNHPDTLNTMFHMALVLERLGKYEEALNINKAVFEKRKETLGSNNLATVSAKNNIALVLASQKKYEEALKLYKEVFEKKKKILGINHTDTLRTLHNIAGIHFSQKNYSEALKGFQEVLNIQKVALLPNHPEALTTEYNIANVLLLQGKYISALKTFTEIHDKMITVFGPHHPKVMGILTKIKIINEVLRFQGSGLSEVLQNHQKEILLLNIAAKEGDVQTVQRLLNDGANVNDKDVDGRTPLHFAVSNGHINVVNMLLQNGAVVTEATKKGNTPLHTATSKGYKEIIEVLLQHISRNRDKLNDFIDAKTTSSGTTSLHIAAKSGFLEIIKSLLKHGAIYNSKNKKGEVPVDVSTDQKTINLLKLIENLFRDVKNGNLGTISKLRSIKPDEFLALTSARNNQGNTLLQVAIFNKHNAIAGEILKMLMTN